jgi:thiaminase
MTIETATPTGAESLAALFDKLVEAVTAQVINQLGTRLTESLEAASGRVIEDWADTYLDDRINNWMENNLDLENDIERAIRDLDLSDMIREEIRDNITFEVTVS